MKRSTRTIAALVTATLLFVASAHVVIQASLEWTLHRETEETGLNWAVHFAKRLPNISTSAGQAEFVDLGHTLRSGRTGQLMRDILEVGDIYQMDIINSTCLCDLSVGSYKSRFVSENADELLVVRQHNLDADHEDHPGHQDHKAKALEPTPFVPPVFFKQQVVEHVLLGKSQHKPKSFSADANLQFPLDRTLALDIVKEKENRVFVHTDGGENQPGTFGEIYHPVLVDDEVAYVVRMLVDLDDETARYSFLFYTGALLILGLLIGSFLYPMRKYWRVHREKGRALKQTFFLSNHDLLTGIANRAAFQGQAAEMIHLAAGKKQPYTLMLLDIYNFNEINEFYGHEVGDRLLKLLALRLSDYFDRDSFVARLAGDEFALIVSNDTYEVKDEKCLPDDPTFMVFDIDGKAIRLDFNIGTVQVFKDGDVLDELLRNAALALHQAKQMGKGAVVVYTKAITAAFRTKMSLLNDFNKAIHNHQIVPFYQPIVCARTGKVQGFESLARWNHPERGLLSPAVFEDALKDRETCMQLGSEMLSMITRDMGKWQKQGVDFGYVGLNITEGDLLKPGFVLDVAKKLADCGLHGSQLVIEVTENCIFADNKALFLEKLEQLRIAGCGVALDDFGTGYSSITHIKDIPVSTVKVDKSFVREIVDNSSDQAIVEALCELGRKIGFKILLEGIEDKQQLTLTRSIGADFIQGFYYSKPVPFSLVPDLCMALNDQDQLLATGTGGV